MAAITIDLNELEAGQPHWLSQGSEASRAKREARRRQVIEEAKKRDRKKRAERLAAKQLGNIEQKFDPDQPRDENGRWSYGGGGGSSGSSSQQSGAGGESSSPSGASGVQNQGGVGGGPSGVELSSSTAAVTAEPLAGAPKTARIPGVGTVDVAPHLPAREAAAKYMERAGIKYNPPKTYVKVDKERAQRIAQAYGEMKDDPNDPVVREAYEAMARETVSQYDAMMGTGLKVEFIDYAKQGDPYAASPRLAIEDVRQNNHLWIFPTSAGFGSDATFDSSRNPLLADSGRTLGGKPACVNDIFRAVHDYFGHVKDGVGMRADGEENAWRAHSAMYSDKARWAMTSETRGQNSWVNFGPHAQANATASGGDTVYADQKVGLLPRWVMEEGAGDKSKRSRRKLYDPDQPRDEDGRFASTGSSGSGGSGGETASGDARGSDYNALVERLAQPDGGFTYQPVTDEMPTRGFAMSPYPDRSFAKPVGEITPDDIIDFAEKNADLLLSDNHFMGAWHDPASGKVFLDVSMVLDDEAEASRVAVEKDQIAYFDLENMRAVTVNPDATSGGAKQLLWLHRYR